MKTSSYRATNLVRGFKWKMVYGLFLLGGFALSSQAAVMDVVVTKSANATNVAIGDQVIFTVAITNRGANSADALFIKDLLPEGATYVGHQASIGTYTPTSGLWSVGNYAAHAVQRTLAITATVTYASVGSIENVASLFATTDTDTNANNNAGTAVLLFTNTTDLGVGKSQTTNLLTLGATNIYTLTVTNFGPLDATGVQVTDFLPSSLGVVSIGAGTFNPTSGVWTIGSLANGSVTSITITTVLTDGSLGQKLLNLVNISSAAQADANGTNNSAFVLSQTPTGTDPDLQIPPSNFEEIPAGSYIIPMGTNFQHYGANPFNLRAYGLVAALLETNIPVKWAIRAGKAKDEADFSALVKQLSPTNIAATNAATTVLSFFGGPFIVHNDFTNFAAPVISAFGGTVAVYQVMATTTVDVRYTLAHKPRIMVMDDGGTDAIHTDMLDEGGIPTNHYTVRNASSVAGLAATTCFTIVTAPHFDAADGGATAECASIRAFIQSGGNFLGQCAAARSYEIQTNGHFATTKGIVDSGTVATNLVNPDTPFAQIHGGGPGGLPNAGGSFTEGILAPGSVFTNNAYKVVLSAANPNVYRALVAKLLQSNGIGSVVFYLGGHSYNGSDTIEYMNGRRMYMNALFVPPDRPTGCGLSFNVDLSITKHDNADPIVAGSNLTYTVVVSNSGPFLATGVVVTDTLPSQVSFISATPSSGVYDNVSGVWTIGTILVHSIETLTLNVNVNSNFTGIISNKVEVTGDEGDPTPTNNVAIEPTTVICETVPPVITCPNDATIQCTESSNPTNTGTATATDNVDPEPVITFTNIVQAGNCPQAFIITRIWKATDSCNNSSFCTQIINVVDTVAPQISCPQSVTIQCTASSNPTNTGSASATDNCDTNPGVNFSDNVQPGNCPQASTIFRTWTATDHCANASSCTQRIEVVDTVAPIISCPATVTIQCTESTSPTNTGSAIASDNCAALTNIVINFSDTNLAAGCAQNAIIARTWTATDPCLNQSKCTQTIFVVDSGAPIITCPPNKTIQCTESTNPTNTGFATGSDSCAGTNVTINFNDNVVTGQCPQAKTITRTWFAEDPCENGSQCTQLITVVDTVPPVITCPPDQTFECQGVDSLSIQGGTVAPINATATDNCDTNPAITFTDNLLTGVCAQASGIARVWKATDDCGNSSTCTQLIAIVDTIAPFLQCPSAKTIQCTESTDPTNTGTAITFDNCDEFPVLHFSDNVQTGSCPQASVIFRTWTSTDHCANASSCTQRIDVVDTVPPTIGAPGANSTIECPNTPAFTPPTKSDNCDTNTKFVVATITNLGQCAGTLTATRTWVATDHCGNASAVVTQIITVVDTTPPTIVTCAPPVTVQCVSDVPAPNTNLVVATDTCSSVTISHVGDSTLTSECGGTITRTYRATDACGNSTTCTQLITVNDTIPPQITCPESPIVVQGDADCRGTVPDLRSQAQVSDNCGTNGLIVTQVPPGGTQFTITTNVTLVATDHCGNTNACTVTLTLPCNPGYTIEKTLTNHYFVAGSTNERPPTVGEQLNFVIIVVNTGNVNLVTVPLVDIYNTNQLAFVSGIPPSDNNANDGAINWSNVGPLGVGASTSVVANFIAVAATTNPPVSTNIVVASPTTPPGTPPPPTPPPQTNDEPFIILNTGQIGDEVWQDGTFTNSFGGVFANGKPDENLTIMGQNGVRVRLTVVGSGVTNELVTGNGPGGIRGYYLFTNLPPAQYRVEVVVDDYPPPVIGQARFSSTPTSYLVNLGPGDKSLTNDFGFVFVIPTAIELKYFEAGAEDGGVRVKWGTAVERETLGFNVYRSDSAEGERVKINDDLILSAGSAVGQDYEQFDATAQAGARYYYWLEDVDWQGRTAIHGPAVVWGQQVAGSKPVAGFEAKQPGLYRISAETLRAAGVDVGGIDPARLQVYVSGHEVSAFVAADSGTLKDEDVLLFYLPDTGKDQAVEVRTGNEPLRMEEVYVGPADGEGDVWYGVAGENNMLSFVTAHDYIRYLLMGFVQEPVWMLDVTDSRKPKLLYGYSSLTLQGDLAVYLSYVTEQPANCLAIDADAVIDVKQVTKK